MVSSPLTVSMMGILQLMAMACAFRLGQMDGKDPSKWPKGGILEGGWAAQRIPCFVILGLAAALTLFLPIINGSGFGFASLFRPYGQQQRMGYQQRQQYY